MVDADDAEAPDGRTVAVVIPAHDPDEAYIRAAVACVIEQDLADWRAIVVDDGSSTELTWLAELDPRISVVVQSHAGVSAARNRGIAEARTLGLPYVALLDSDDLWEPGKLSAQVAAFAAQPNLTCLATSFDHVDSSGRYLADGFGSDDGSYEAILRGNSRHTSSLMFRRSALDQLSTDDGEGPFRRDLVACEDLALLLDIAEKGLGSISTLTSHGVLSHYRFHYGNTSSTKYRRVRTDFEDILRGHRRRARDAGNLLAADAAAASIRGTRSYFGGRALEAARSAVAERRFFSAANHLGYALWFAPRKSIAELRLYRPRRRTSRKSP